jgi:hypothetical protein
MRFILVLGSHQGGLFHLVMHSRHIMKLLSILKFLIKELANLTTPIFLTIIFLCANNRSVILEWGYDHPRRPEVD